MASLRSSSWARLGTSSCSVCDEATKLAYALRTIGSTSPRFWRLPILARLQCRSIRARVRQKERGSLMLSNCDLHWSRLEVKRE